jgi:hypothetical protein
VSWSVNRPPWRRQHGRAVPYVADVVRGLQAVERANARGLDLDRRRLTSDALYDLGRTVDVAWPPLTADQEYACLAEVKASLADHEDHAP